MSNSTLTVRNLTIADGYSPAGGGPGPGGGIALYRGQLQLENTTVAGNVATGAGGGIDARGSVTLTNSTLSGNQGSSGGGIALDSGTLVLANSTIAQNSSGAAGGVLARSGTSVILRNSIVAGNTLVVGNTVQNCALSELPAIQGLNISDDNTCGGGAGMRVADPLLGPLAANGGPTQTHAILSGSPAIDAAVSCTVTVDQRYVSRPQGAACDVGAYEFDGYVSVALTIDNSIYVNPRTGAAVLTGSLSCSQGAPLDLQFALAQTVKGRVPATTQASASSTLACTTAVQYWSMVLAPSSGSFAPGSATATVQTANTSPWVTPAGVTQAVRLFWGKG